MLRQQDVGHRVVVRRIVGVSGDRTLFTDALGELVDLTETDLTLATDKGTVRVPLREVHRAKRVPAEPLGRPSAERTGRKRGRRGRKWPLPRAIPSTESLRSSMLLDRLTNAIPLSSIGIKSTAPECDRLTPDKVRQGRWKTAPAIDASLSRVEPWCGIIGARGGESTNGPFAERRGCGAAR